MASRRRVAAARCLEWHLRKVFGKLGIRSRRELASALPTPTAQLVTA
jgi:hypothetical protein